MFIATLAIGNAFVPAEKAVSLESAGHDFLAFYTAGTFLRDGRAHELYDLATISTFQHELAAREGIRLGRTDLAPYWNPPFYAWTFVPLSTMTYRAAWSAWLAVNLAAAAGAVVLLVRMLPGDWRTRGLVPLLLVTSLPFIEALGHGQNTCTSLLLLAATVTRWRSGRTFAAGATCGLLFYKPQLGAVLAAALVLTAGLRPLCGLAVTGALLLSVNLLTLPGTLDDFLHRLPANISFMQIDRPYLWDRHVTLKAFWRLLIQGYETGEMTLLARALWLATATALAGSLALILWKLRRAGDALSRDRAIAATIVCMPLLMPFYFDYDLLLLAAPAVLVARERASGQGVVGGRLVALWIVLAGWLVVNGAIAKLTHVNGTVLLLIALAAVLLRRAWRDVRPARADGPPAGEGADEPQPLRRAA